MADGGQSEDYLQALAIYDSLFPRYQSVEPQIHRVEEFPGLEVKNCWFASNHGQKLVGYIYRRSGCEPLGVIVLAHGLGVGGQCVYMAAADYFAAHGYLVFAYDATGNDQSEGESGIGMEQGIIDLSAAIAYVEQDSELGGYPIALYGHSWGAYCVGAVLLDHPEVKAVVAVSGFNSSAEWMRYMLEASDSDGRMAVLQEHVEQIERIKFGRYADYSALAGFANTKACVMLIQSRDDRNVPQGVGYDLYAKKYQQDQRFRFRLFEDRGHMYIFYTEAARAYDLQYMDELTLTPTEYGKAHSFDKTIGYALDLKLFADIVDFINQSCREKQSCTHEDGAIGWE